MDSQYNSRGQTDYISIAAHHQFPVCAYRDCSAPRPTQPSARQWRKGGTRKKCYRSRRVHGDNELSDPLWLAVTGSRDMMTMLQELCKFYTQDFDMIFERDTDPIDLFCQQDPVDAQEVLLDEFSIGDGQLPDLG